MTVAEKTNLFMGMKDKDKVDQKKRTMKNEKEMEWRWRRRRKKHFPGNASGQKKVTDKQTEGMNHLHFTKKWNKALFTFFTERD